MLFTGSRYLNTYLCFMRLVIAIGKKKMFEFFITTPSLFDLNVSENLLLLNRQSLRQESSKLSQWHSK